MMFHKWKKFIDWITVETVEFEPVGNNFIFSGVSMSNNEYVCDRCGNKFLYFDTAFEYNNQFTIKTGFPYSKRGTPCCLDDDIKYCLCDDCCSDLIKWLCKPRIEKKEQKDKKLEFIDELNKFTGRINHPADVFIFTVKLCDNQVDRDYERFTENAIEQMKDLFVGKSGFVGDNCLARIFKTYVDRHADYDVANKEVVTLYGVAYVVRTALNSDIIKEIEAGIRKDVSISCSCTKRICSVCGANILENPCHHVRGLEYSKQVNNIDLTIRCCHCISYITDVYEWSFVEVPYSAKNNIGGD